MLPAKCQSRWIVSKTLWNKNVNKLCPRISLKNLQWGTPERVLVLTSSVLAMVLHVLMVLLIQVGRANLEIGSMAVLREADMRMVSSRMVEVLLRVLRLLLFLVRVLVVRLLCNLLCLPQVSLPNRALLLQRLLCV
jgi:hypothetical protein